MPTTRHTQQRDATEWSFKSGNTYADPFNEIEVDVLFTDAAGRQWRIPAYWAGGSEWRVRFAPPESGDYHYQTACSDTGNGGLHGQTGTLHATPYTGDNALLRHGPLRISKDHRRFEHADGKPFFWLGDTWWMSLCHRLHWPDEFQLLTADRREKGFTVIQVIAGLYPDMPAFDPRGANEAGFPWTPDYERINPAYFDAADLRIQWLVRSGLVPCIVGCWGYFLPWMGVEKLKKHWRNIVARWSAYPVMWCAAGEAAMAYYLSKNPEADRKLQVDGWTEITRYIRSIDPYRHPVTAHPTSETAVRDNLTDSTVLDFEMFQGTHGPYPGMTVSLKVGLTARNRQPLMPVVNSESNYEGILENNRQETQRFLLWTGFLSGLAGFTYGANGLWQLNRREAAYGPSPHGASWGDIPWDEAYRLPGAAHIALGKRWLEQFEWWRFEPHQEWITPAAETDKLLNPFAGGIPGEVRIIYFPLRAPWGQQPTIKLLEPGLRYRATYFNPVTGQELPLGVIQGDATGAWETPIAPLIQDWVLVLRRV